MTNDLTREQYDVLMRPLTAGRVKQRKVGSKALSYLEAFDVRAHLTRIFGFGGFSDEILSCALLYCDRVADKGNWNVSYQVTMRLSVPQLGACWDDGAVGSAHLPDRGEALDMALKTAVSDALKRCAVNLGTQFGLSLYKDGQLADVVRATLVAPDAPQAGGTGVEGERRPQDSDVADIAEVGEETEDPTAVSEVGAETVNTSTGEIGTDDGIAAQEANLFLANLRGWAKEVDSAKRVMAVAQLKTEAHGQPWLNQTTSLPNGATVTLARLADMVAQGIWANGEQDA